MSAGRLVARTVIGGLFAGHGAQKLFGWFDGPGPEGTRQMVESLGMKPVKRNAQAVSLTEFLGGIALVLGAATPVAGTALTAAMATAIRKVHASNGPWNTNGGYEYNLVLIAAVAAIIDGGPGKPSVDGALGIDRTGPVTAIAAVLAGIGASHLAIEAGKRAAASDSDAAERTEYPLSTGEEAEPAIAEPTVSTA